MRKSEFEQSMTDAWESYLSDCPVPPLAAVDTITDGLIGCIIPAPFPSNFSNIHKLSPKRRSIALLLQALEESYLSGNPPLRDTILIDLAVVSSQARGRGIYQRLRKEIQVSAKKAGFRNIAGELSSTATQKVCVQKFGQRVVAEIYFAQYKEKDRYPFSSITTPTSIQLVIGDL